MEIDIFRAIIDLAATLGFAFFAYKFHTLNNAFVFSIKEMGELILLLAQYDHLESSQEKIERLARLLERSPEDVRVEVERGNLMRLIGLKAAQIMAHMQANVPGSHQLFEELGRWNHATLYTR